MSDTRYALKNYDQTTTGGVLIATTQGMTHHGTPVGVEGDFATCPACKVGGPVFNDCHPNFSVMGKQILVTGARVHCKCERKPWVIHSQSDFTVEVERGDHRGPAPVYVPQHEHGHEEYAREKVSAEKPSSLEDHPELICPNMTNAEFARKVMQRRDKAISLIDKRIVELRGWSPTARDRVAQWFGNSDIATRDNLAGGLSRIRQVLAGLTPSNFVRYSEAAMAQVGCVSNPKAKLGVVAEVCAPDTATHTIAIHLDFCELRDFSYSLDSQVSTLVHEVSHFNDTMSTGDPVYFMRKCRELAKTNPEITLHNADSIAGYVIYED